MLQLTRRSNISVWSLYLIENYAKQRHAKRWAVLHADMVVKWSCIVNSPVNCPEAPILSIQLFNFVRIFKAKCHLLSYMVELKEAAEKLIIAIIMTLGM